MSAHDRRPGSGQQLRERRDHRRPGRRPVADEVRLARPGARRRSCSPTRSTRRTTPARQSATGVTLTDTLPAGVTFDSATPSQGTCSESSGTVTCALGTLAERRRARPSRSRSARSTPGTITNQAAVSPTSATRTRQQLRERRDDRRPRRRPVAHQDRLARPGARRAASDLHASRVHNAGPSSATGVQLTDTLPAGVTFDSATPSQGSCSESSGTVTCALGTHRRRRERHRRDQGPPHAPGTITNQATSVRRRPATRSGQQLRERRRPRSTRPPTCR